MRIRPTLPITVSARPRFRALILAGYIAGFGVMLVLVWLFARRETAEIWDPLVLLHGAFAAFFLVLAVHHYKRPHGSIEIDDEGIRQMGLFSTLIPWRRVGSVELCSDPFDSTVPEIWISYAEGWERSFLILRSKEHDFSPHDLFEELNFLWDAEKTGDNGRRG